MKQFNLQTKDSVEINYQNGLLPQRNNRDLFYIESSCRSDLSEFQLSSENRRIINKTKEYNYQRIPTNELLYTPQLQKTLSLWVKNLGWDFPTNSIKTIFTNHIFNFVYIWKDQNNIPVAYSVCYFSENISHIAYVFYDPQLNHSNLPIRLVLQTIIDSQDLGLKYCYLGRFSNDIGYYKRNMPGFQYFTNHEWLEYNKDNLI